MEKPTILYIYSHPNPSFLMDGLWAALNLLESDFHILKWNLALEDQHTPFSPDFILGWGAFGSSVDKVMQEYKNLHLGVFDHHTTPMGLCIAGNTFPPTGADSYDVLFYETKWYRPQINFHKNIVHAFGYNSDIYFTSDVVHPIVYDYIGVGAFAKWKRWDKMKDKKGIKLVIGEYQVNNEEESGAIVRDLIKNGVMVSNMVHPFDLSNLYHYARTLYMPSDIYGGGERSILEARACGIDVEIEDDNPKLKELVDCELRDHLWYAQQLKKGILSVL